MSNQVLAGIFVAIFAYFLVGMCVYMEEPLPPPKWVRPTLWMAYALATLFSIGFICSIVYCLYKSALAAINLIPT